MENYEDWTVAELRAELATIKCKRHFMFEFINHNCTVDTPRFMKTLTAWQFQELSICIQLSTGK